MGRRAEFLDIQKPLKKKYRNEPGSSRITLVAKASQQDIPISCSVDVGRAVYEAEAHAGTGGTGEIACSGDLLLGALAACAQVTCQMVAEAMGIETERIEVTVTGRWISPERSASPRTSPSASRLSTPASTSWR